MPTVELLQKAAGDASVQAAFRRSPAQIVHTATNDWQYVKSLVTDAGALGMEAMPVLLGLARYRDHNADQHEGH